MAKTYWPNPGDRLSEREHEILYWVSHGLTNPQIGKQLYLSEDTVKSHCRRIFRKMGAKDRAHAVRLGFESGILFGGKPILPPAPSTFERLGDPTSSLVKSLEALGWTPPPRVMSPERAS